MNYNFKTISRGSVQQRVVDEGQGPCILLMHGFPDSHYLWRHQIPALVEAGYRVVAPDHRGFGGSDKPEGVEHFRIAEIVADTLNILDELGIEKAAIVGHDWGSTMSWGLVDAAPERFTCFMPMSVGTPQNYLGGDSLKQREIGWYILFFQYPDIPEQMLAADDWKLFRQWARQHSEVSHWISELSKPGVLKAGINIYRANLTDFMGGLSYRSKVPTKGLWSSEDAYLVEAQMLESGRYVEAEWSYERVEGASHWLMLDMPGHITRLILNFVRKHHS